MPPQSAAAARQGSGGVQWSSGAREHSGGTQTAALEAAQQRAGMHGLRATLPTQDAATDVYAGTAVVQGGIALDGAPTTVRAAAASMGKGSSVSENLADDTPGGAVQHTAQRSAALQRAFLGAQGVGVDEGGVAVRGSADGKVGALRIAAARVSHTLQHSDVGDGGYSGVQAALRRPLQGTTNAARTGWGSWNMQQDLHQALPRLQGERLPLAASTVAQGVRDEVQEQSTRWVAASVPMDDARAVSEAERRAARASAARDGSQVRGQSLDAATALVQASATAPHAPVGQREDALRRVAQRDQEEQRRVKAAEEYSGGMQYHDTTSGGDTDGVTAYTSWRSMWGL